MRQVFADDELLVDRGWIEVVVETFCWCGVSLHYARVPAPTLINHNDDSARISCKAQRTIELVKI